MKKTIIVIAVVLVSALLLGVFATGSNLFGAGEWLSGFGYKYEVTGSKLVTPDKYFGRSPITTRVSADGAGKVTEVSNLSNEFILLYRLDEQHPSIKVYNADTGEVYFSQAIADLEGDYYGAWEGTGCEYTAVSGCAEILGAFVHRETDTKFPEYFVKGIKNYKDSGDVSHPYAADIKLEKDKYYVAYLYKAVGQGGEDIDLELDGADPNFYMATTDDYKYVIFKADDSKVTFKTAKLNAVIQIYEIPDMSDASWSPTESTPGEFDVTEPSAGADVTTEVTTWPEGAGLPQIDPGAPEGPG